MNSKIIKEGIEVGDLVDVLVPELKIDEFQSKLGNNDKNIVVAIPIKDKTAATDLVEFLETGYNYILDADISASEYKPGIYLVFFELLRRTKAAKQLFKIIDDLQDASKIERKKWFFTYMKEEEKYPLTEKIFDKVVPQSPKAYRRRFELPINSLRDAAGLPTPIEETIDPIINSLKHSAGLR